jgi:broad specificity phosphatase PhoE
MRGMIRTWLLAALLALCPPALAEEPWEALRQGGVLILMRHAITEPGTGDPPGFRLDDCKTQRQLSTAGRAQAQRLGALLAARGVRPLAVFSSAWCRCVDTGTLAFPAVPVKHFPALDSVFMDNSREPAQTAALREAIGRIPRSGVTVWVTHQANVTALTGEYLGMGNALVLRPVGAGKFRVLGRLDAPQR